jgi:hypothetical protein
MGVTTVWGARIMQLQLSVSCAFLCAHCFWISSLESRAPGTAMLVQLSRIGISERENTLRQLVKIECSLFENVLQPDALLTIQHSLSVETLRLPNVAPSNN